MRGNTPAWTTEDLPVPESPLNEAALRQAHAVQDLVHFHVASKKHPSILAREMQQAGVRRTLFLDIPGDGRRGGWFFGNR
jgi:hypothetical protein